MNPTKPTYASVLKNSSSTLDPKTTAKPLIAKPIRARLSKEAKANLRAAIKGEETMIVVDSTYKTVVYVEEPPQPSNTNWSQWFHSQPKQDDLADAYIQALYISFYYT